VVNADSDTVILTEEGTDLFDGMGDILTSGPPWARGVSKQHRGAPVSGGTTKRSALLFLGSVTRDRVLQK
jgi:hypothetical protein